MPSRYYLFILALLACPVSASDETPVQIIELAPPLDRPEAEISGLTWCGDTLVLMPQYPKRFSENKQSFFYTLTKQTITDYLRNPDTGPLQATPIRLHENALREKVTIFDGFEAISCRGKDLWLSIEAVNIFTIYQSYLVKASVNFDLKEPVIDIDSSKLWSLDSQSEMRNMGDEAILLNGNDVLSIHEVNDANIIDVALANVLDTKASEQSHYRMSHLPFRITDSTELDKDNRFWVMNYKYSGDKFSRKSRDPLAERYGQGTSHQKYHNVERLVEFELRQDEQGEHFIQRVERAPIQLKMEGVEGRNWEGLVRLDDIGFLIATDKHPETLLGFVPLTTLQPPATQTKPAAPDSKR